MTNRVEDELAIRNLLSRYSDAVWRVDRAAYAAVWTVDARWEILGMTFEGRDVLVEKWLEFMGQVIRNWQIVHCEMFDISGDHGTGKVYVNEVMTGIDGVTKATMGTYADEYVKQDGQWLFKCRKFDLVYLGAVDYSDSFAEGAGFPKGT